MFVTANFNTLGFVVVIYLPELVPPDGVLICFQFFWLFSLIVTLMFPLVK